MNILLINYADKNMKVSEPLGICYLAAELRNKAYNVDLLDSRVEELELEEFAEFVCKISSKYSIIGISTALYFGMSVKESPTAVIVEKLRSINYAGHITMGGYGPSLDYKNYINLGADSVIVGEGEIIIRNLADAIRDGKDFRQLKGIVYINSDGQIVRNENECIADFDTIASPVRDILFEFEKKFGAINLNPAIQASRGCYMNCAYCSTPQYMRNQGGPIYRTRSIVKVVDEIEDLYRRGFTNFDFIDDNFLPADKDKAMQRALEFRNEIVKRNIKITFFMEFRLEYISCELLEILKEAGLRRLFIGIESFNAEDLKLFNRTYSVEKMCDAIDEILKAGFNTELNSEYRFRYGIIRINPLSTIASLKNTGEYFKKYQLTYKKLCKKLFLYDNNSDILHNVVAQFPEYSSENYFKYKEVADFYRYFNEYHGIYVKIRNKGRNYEKCLLKRIKAEIASEQEFVLLKELETMRYELDRDIYDVYMGGLDAAEQNEEKEMLKQFFEEKRKQFENIRKRSELFIKRASSFVGEEFGDLEKFYA